MYRHLLTLCVLTAAVAALADPGAVTWSGGTLRLMEEHPSVSLVAETIVLEPNLTDTVVTVDLQFHNSGEARVVPMGFPTLAFSGPGYHFVRDFTVEAGGEALPVTVAEASRIALGERELPCVWHLFDAPFEADADLSMTVRYREVREHYWKMLRVPYVLATGASWQGDVRSVDLEVRLAERRNLGDVTLGVGPPIDATPHPGPLSLEEDGNSLRWRAEDYDGMPAVITLQAELGPGTVTDDAGGYRSRSYQALAWWQDDRALIEADYLADCLLATVLERSDEAVTFAKEGRSVELAVTRLEGELVPREIELVDPAAALEAFGGAVETSIEDDGDLAVCVTTCPDSAQSAQATALFPTQALDYRLRALRRLAERWPEATTATCQDILAHDREEAMVLAWCIGHLEQAGTPVERAWELVSRLSGAGRWEAQVGEAILSATDGCEFAGALAMVEPTAVGMRSALIDGISACENWKDARARGMNAGMAMRRLDCPGAADALMADVRRHGGHQESEDAMVALGALGDDLAIEFLKAQALNAGARTRDINCAAAQALALIGSPAAVQACFDLWRATDDREVQSRAFCGLQLACGQSHPVWRMYGRMLPEWESPRMPVEEGQRLCRELLEGFDVEGIGEKRANDHAGLLRYLDRQAQAARTRAPDDAG